MANTPLSDARYAKKAFTDFYTQLKQRQIHYFSQIDIAKKASGLQTLNVVVVGATGSGKSTVVQALTGQDTPITSWHPHRTERPTPYDTPGKWRIIDTEGFESWGELEFTRFDKTILNPEKEEDRPCAVLYCHHAAHKFVDKARPNEFTGVEKKIGENEREFIQKALKGERPVFFVLTDIYSVDSKVLGVVREGMKTVLEEVADARAVEIDRSTHTVHKFGDRLFSCLVNSVEKEVKDVITGQVTAKHAAFGIDNLLEIMLSNIPEKLALTVFAAVEERTFQERLSAVSARILIDVWLFFTVNAEQRDQVLQKMLQSQEIAEKVKELGFVDGNISLEDLLRHFVKYPRMLLPVIPFLMESLALSKVHQN